MAQNRRARLFDGAHQLQGIRVMILNQLPEDLPEPEEDGACDHLSNFKLPSIQLTATNGEIIDFSIMNCVVIYCYPMTGRPDIKLPDGWDQIPGARGCTSQSCAFKDHYNELQNLGADVYGLSNQPSEYQQEAKNRLHLPFELVSDNDNNFINALRIPTLQVEGINLSKRVTLIAKKGIITKVFYPVFPPDKNADQVIEYLHSEKY